MDENWNFELGEWSFSTQSGSSWKIRWSLQSAHQSVHFRLVVSRGRLQSSRLEKQICRNICWLAVSSHLEQLQKVLFISIARELNLNSSLTYIIHDSELIEFVFFLKVVLIWVFVHMEKVFGDQCAK